MQVNVPDPHAITLVLMGDTLVGMMSILPTDQVLAALKAASANIEAQIAAQQAEQSKQEDPPAPDAPAEGVTVDLPIPDVAPGESVTTTHEVDLPGGGTLTINHTHTNTGEAETEDAPTAETDGGA